MIHIKCPQCGEFSTDENICLSCGAELKSEKTHKKTIEKQHKERISKPIEPPKIMVVLKKWQQHPNIILQGLGYLLYSVAFVLFAIFSFIAWFIAAIAV